MCEKPEWRPLCEWPTNAVFQCTLGAFWQALCEAGASRWTANEWGETPAALLEGLVGLSPDQYRLHRSCTMGNFFCGDVPGRRGAVAASRLMLRALACPADYCTPPCLEPLAAAMRTALTGVRSGSGPVAGLAPGQASVLARSLVGQEPQARAYLALALLLERYGVMATLTELEGYLEDLTTTGQGVVVDPIIYVLHYRLWVANGRSRSRRATLRVSSALSALRLFPAFASGWVAQSDSADLSLTHRTPADSDVELNSEEEGEEPRDPNGPEAQWELAKPRLRRLGVQDCPSMDQIMRMAGLYTVKCSAMGIVKELILARERPSGVKTDTALNFLFVGALNRLTQSDASPLTIFTQNPHPPVWSGKCSCSSLLG